MSYDAKEMLDMENKLKKNIKIEYVSEKEWDEVFYRCIKSIKHKKNSIMLVMRDIIYSIWSIKTVRYAVYTLLVVLFIFGFYRLGIRELTKGYITASANRIVKERFYPSPVNKLNKKRNRTMLFVGGTLSLPQNNTTNVMVVDFVR